MEFCVCLMWLISLSWKVPVHQQPVHQHDSAVWRLERLWRRQRRGQLPWVQTTDCLIHFTKKIKIYIYRTGYSDSPLLQHCMRINSPLKCEWALFFKMEPNIFVGCFERFVSSLRATDGKSDSAEIFFVSLQNARRLRWSVKMAAVNRSSGNATGSTTVATALTRRTAVSFDWVAV